MTGLSRESSAGRTAASSPRGTVHRRAWAHENDLSSRCLRASVAILPCLCAIVLCGSRGRSPERASLTRTRTAGTLVDEQQHVSLDPHRPAQRADAQPRQPFGVSAGDEDPEPRDDRDDPPEAADEEERDEVRNRQQQPQPDRQAVASLGRRIRRPSASSDTRRRRTGGSRPRAASRTPSSARASAAPAA